MYCSGDNQEFKLVYTPDLGVTVVSPKGSEHFTFGGSAGTGLNGRVFYNKSKNSSIKILWASVEMDANEGYEDVRPIEILDDRVYWPCQ